MANSFKFELDKDGVRQLMQSKEMQNVLASHAKSVQNRAGSGYSVSMGQNRTTIFVYTKDKEAEMDNLEKNTLLRSLHK